MPDPRRRQHIRRVQHHPAFGPTAPLGNLGRVERRRVGAGGSSEFVFEGLAVDDDVHRHGRAAIAPLGGDVDGPHQRIEPALAGGADHQRLVHPVPMVGHTGSPLIVPFQLGVVVEDLLQLHAMSETADRVQIHPRPDETDRRVPVAVCSVVALVGTIGVGGLFPPAQHGDAIIERQGARVPNEKRFRFRHSIGDPRVGHHRRHRVHLGDADLPCQRRHQEQRHQFERASQLGEPCRLGRRPVARRTPPGLHRPVPVRHECRGAVDPQRVQTERRFGPAALEIQTERDRLHLGR